MLPHIIRTASAELKLPAPAPIDLMALMGGPDQTSTQMHQPDDYTGLMNSNVHPACAGHQRIAETLAREVFREVGSQPRS